jgi:phosphoserine phosphatase RsbU/P
MGRQGVLLVIEDDPGVRSSLAAYLEDSGYRVIEAGDGARGLELFAAHRPDLVLTDIRMPLMDGFEVLSWLGERSPETPVIVISGTGDECAAATALSCGAREFLTKPIHDLQDLVLAVGRALTGII